MSFWVHHFFHCCLPYNFVRFQKQLDQSCTFQSFFVWIAFVSMFCSSLQCTSAEFSIFFEMDCLTFSRLDVGQMHRSLPSEVPFDSVCIASRLKSRSKHASFHYFLLPCRFLSAMLKCSYQIVSLPDLCEYSFVYCCVTRKNPFLCITGRVTMR